MVEFIFHRPKNPGYQKEAGHIKAEAIKMKKKAMRLNVR